MTDSSNDPIHGPGIETVHLSSPQDLLSAIPYLLGYQPDHGLVVLGLDDQERLVVTISTDLPLLRDTADVAGGITQYLARVATVTVLVVGYCPHRKASTLSRFADLLPWPVRELLLVSDQRWRSLHCTDTDCCPPDGRPLVQQDRIAAPLLAATGAPAPSRGALATSLGQGPDDIVDRVRAHLDAAATSSAATDAHSGYAALAQARTDRAAGPAHLPPEQAAVLLAALQNQTVRDACVLWNDDAGLALWHDLLNAAPPGWVAPAATLLALAAYLRGDGVLAQLAAGRALDDAPDYALARLIQGVLRYGLPPDGLSDALAIALRDHPLVNDPPPAT